MSNVATKRTAYDLGRERGLATERTEPTDEDRDWLAGRTDEPLPEDHDAVIRAFDQGMRSADRR